MKKPEKECPHRSELAIRAPADDPQLLVAEDGRIRPETVRSIGLSEKNIRDIADHAGVTIEDIGRWNDLKDTKIRIGDKLIIRK